MDVKWLCGGLYERCRGLMGVWWHCGRCGDLVGGVVHGPVGVVVV